MSIRYVLQEPKTIATKGGRDDRSPARPTHLQAPLVPLTFPFVRAVLDMLRFGWL